MPVNPDLREAVQVAVKYHGVKYVKDLLYEAFGMRKVADLSSLEQQRALYIFRRAMMFSLRNPKLASAFPSKPMRPKLLKPPPPPHRNPPLKIAMLLHFYGTAEPFAPEKTRTSNSYVQFVKELLREGLIERPTPQEREVAPGWAYKATEKGRVMVGAICAVQNPVSRWTMPS